jgi:hypothetical protein
MAAFNPHIGLDYYAAKLSHECTSTSRKDTNAFEASISQSFPSRYTGERVWTGADMVMKHDQWIVVMSEDDRFQIMKALKHFKGSLRRLVAGCIRSMLIIDRDGT